MVIGIEAERANAAQKTGVEHYARQLIEHLAQVDSQNQYVLYLRSSPQDWFLRLPRNFRVKVMPFPVFWTQLRLSWEMLVAPVDVLLIPASALPLIHPRNSVVTIHDLAWKYYPETFTFGNRIFLDWSTGFAVWRAKSVIAVSEATKQDLARFYQVPPGKIQVVHHGFDAELENAGTENLPSGLPEAYVLYLSTLQPRKNPVGLIEAFVSLKKTHPELRHKLVMVGKPGWKYGPILEKIRRYPDLVVYLNHLPDSQRNAVLKKARLMVLPSFYEGFGMTVLEAFAARVPVALADVSSLPEVAGNAAIYFNPHDARDIMLAMEKVLLDPGLAQRLADAGSERLKDFSWKKCAEATLQVLTQSYAV